MQKIIALLTLAGLGAMILGPVFTAADTGLGPIPTKVTPDTTGGAGSDSILVKAKWEMYTEYDNKGFEEPGYENTPGAQLAAPGQWGENLEYTVCAVVHGRDKNPDNISHVIAEIFYPNRPMHVTDPEVSCGNGIKNADGEEIDNPSGGCGAKIEQNQLEELSQEEGIDLVCNKIWPQNPNLIEAWATGEDYHTLCNSDDGQLIKGWAKVYCADKTLTWEDPAGDYKVVVMAYDTNGTESKLTNSFTYLETRGFDIDFMGTGVDYGSVKISEHKKVYGNKCFLANDNLPTIRNLGNVRLQIKIAQDDMGLGKKTGSDEWNVKFDARIGDSEGDWEDYEPFGEVGENPDTDDWTEIREILDLSEIEEMDFSIHVIEKWPENKPVYEGNMWLTAEGAGWDNCSP